MLWQNCTGTTGRGQQLEMSQMLAVLPQAHIGHAQVSIGVAEDLDVQRGCLEGGQLIVVCWGLGEAISHSI